MEKISDILNTHEMQTLQQEIEQHQNKYKTEVDSFWENLSYEDKLKAFYYITSKIYQGDVVDNGSYRYCLYSKFNFDMDAYALGMDSGYLALHNIIGDGLEFDQMKTAETILIGKGDVVELKIPTDHSLRFEFDNDTKTLKIFTDKLGFLH